MSSHANFLVSPIVVTNAEISSEPISVNLVFMLIEKELPSNARHTAVLCLLSAASLTAALFHNRA